MSLQKVAKGTFFLYIGSIVCRALGYVYWIIISRISGPEVIGVASTTVSLAMLVLAIAYLDIPTGAQRFLGKAVGLKNMNSFKAYLRVELTMVGLTTCFAALLLLLLRNELSALIGLPKEYILIAASMVVIMGLVIAFRAIFISLLRTKELIIADIAGSVIRLPIGVVLITLGLGGLGATLGHFTLHMTTLAFLAISSISIVGLTSLPKLYELKTKGVQIIKAGMAIWPSGVLTVLGPQIGVVIVYGSQGAVEAGLYYIAQAMMMLVIAISSSIMIIMLPLLSGMADKRKRIIWRVMRISLAISTPIMVIAFLYSGIAFGFLGQEFLLANSILMILLISVPPSIIISGVSNLAYAYGLYRKVLSIGLAASLTRVILYLILTPRFGGVGAAEAFLTGTIVSFLVACFIAREFGLKINWKDVIKLISIPAMVGLFVYFIKLHWILGSMLIVLMSLLAFTRLELITKRDMKEIAKAYLPHKFVKIGIDRFNWILKMLYGE